MGQKFIKLSNFRRRQTVCGYILVGVSFLLLSLLTVKIFAPQVETDAASQTASQTVGPYSLSMANDSVATINITPTASQAVYTASNNLSVTNTCTSGATITMTVNSTTSNALTRSATNSDTLTKTIAATSGSSLVDNSWGYSKNNGTNYYPVPLKNATPATIYDASAAQTSALSVPVLFGVKTDNNLPSGNYTNTVVYTMTPKSGCLTYSITWDMDGGTKKSGATYPTSKGWGETVNLSQLTPTKSGYTFDGWTNGSSTFTGSETAANLNSANAKTVTVKAKWKSNCTGDCSEIDVAVNGYVDYSYTGSVKGVTLKKAGYYKLEVWGAQGGKHLGVSTSNSRRGSAGYGGYSYGAFNSSANNILYIVVGGEGLSARDDSSGNYKWFDGGYNGGGRMYYSCDWNGSGGGATHIATKSGLLSSLESYKSSVLIVAGGGGTGSVGDAFGVTKMGYSNGGGYIGASGNATVGNQTTGGSGGQAWSGDSQMTSQNIIGSFGQGGVGFGCNGGCGGGGWYGGGGSTGSITAGGGSGYIGNSLLLSAKGVTKQMYMHSTGCTSSTAAATKTTCTTSTGAHVANAANTGNGYARITYLGT